jgi:hypothetical protein
MERSHDDCLLLSRSHTQALKILQLDALTGGLQKSASRSSLQSMLSAALTSSRHSTMRFTPAAMMLLASPVMGFVQQTGAGSFVNSGASIQATRATSSSSGSKLEMSNPKVQL